MKLNSLNKNMADNFQEVSKASIYHLQAVNTNRINTNVYFQSVASHFDPIDKLFADFFRVSQ